MILANLLCVLLLNITSYFVFFFKRVTTVSAITKPEIEATNLGIKGWAAVPPAPPTPAVPKAKPVPKARPAGKKEADQGTVLRGLLSSFKENALDLERLQAKADSEPGAWDTCKSTFERVEELKKQHAEDMESLDADTKNFHSDFELALMQPKKFTELKKRDRYPEYVASLVALYQKLSPDLKDQHERIKRIKTAADGDNTPRAKKAKKVKT